jgi:hypothetical protein
MTKQFKIGEYAVGGIIKVVIVGNYVSIDALDYNTKQPIPFVREQFNIKERWEIDEMLNKLTSSYYADKILNYIYSKN